MPRDLLRIKRELGATYADLIYNGLWFTPTRQAIDAFAAATQQQVTGEVRLRLKGACLVTGRRSPYALYDHSLATYGKGDAFDHKAAEGFIQLWGLPVETVARQSARVSAHAGGSKPPNRVNGFPPPVTAGHARSAIVADWVGL